MNPPNRLAALFSPTLRAVGVDTPLLRGGMFGGRLTVAPRAECEYRRLDFTTLPARRRTGALRIALARFLEAGVPAHVAWTGGIAHLWLWRMAPPATSQSGQAWAPESRWRAPPLSDGVRLVTMLRGVEGQYWRDRRLATSQWWPHTPVEDDWLRFIRSSGLDPQSHPSVPPVENVPWAIAPWGVSRRRWAGDAAMQERWLWIGASTLLAVAAGWQFAAWRYWREARQVQEQALEQARTKAGPVLAARERAEALREEAAHLLKLQTHSLNDFALVGEFMDSMPDGTRLKLWSRESGKLRAMVRIESPDARELVMAFSGAKSLSNVRVSILETGDTHFEFVLPVPESNEEDEALTAAGMTPGEGRGNSSADNAEESP